MKTLLRALSICCLAALALLTAQAQPANDNFANAWILTGTSATTNGNSGQQFFGIPNATKEAGEPNHAGFVGGRSVWFAWTAPSSGPTRIDTIGSAFNTLLAVYTGTAVNALTPIASNDNFGGGTNTSLVQFNAQQGTTYRIAVDGRNNNGGGASSGPYVLHLQVLISVTITTPANNSLFAVGAPIPVSVTATLGNPVTQVDLYRAGTLVASDSTAPYDFTITNAPLGTNSLYAVATDNTSQVLTSAVVNVRVVNPGVIITSPADGAIFLNTNPITVAATALASSGSMTNVEFFVDGQKFGEDSTSPFSALWSGVTPGAHSFTATGKSDGGISYTSAPVAIAVARTLAATNSVWKYLDDGSDQGAGWIAPGFDDGSWTNGPSPLGYGDVGGVLPATTVAFGPDPNNKYITTYFRQAFAVSNVASFSNLTLRLQRDDGAIVYLNGVEVFRTYMTNGTVAFNTFAGLAGTGPAVPDDGATWFSTDVNAGLLAEGTNVLAVEVHQADLTSSDIWIDLELLGIPSIPRNLAPLIAFTEPTNNAYFLAPSNVTLTATASDSDGSVAKVEFFIDGSKLGETTNGNPYSFVWTNPPVGSHVVNAVATDDQGASSTAQIAVTVYDAAGTPLARITSPANGAVFEGPTNLTLTATATAPNGVTNVQFVANGTAIGNDTTSPFSIVWTNATFGTNLLTAVAYDAQGPRGTSTVVTVTVNAPPPNTNAPTILSRNPAAGASISSLTSIQVLFSERVVGVDAPDLLVNGVPASKVSGTGSTNYTFTVAQPAFGTVFITWATNHRIEDVGFPPLPFDATGPGATWTYNLLDVSPPTVVTQSPPAGATVTNLTQVTVTFSELVDGVNASDLLINGVSAIGLNGGGSNYVFSFFQPPSGTVTISWAANHGIADLAAPPNAFNATGPGATWSYTLDTRTIFLQTNSAWLFIKGLAEASSPFDAWRQLNFDDSFWSNALAPFYYGDPYNSPGNPGTLLSDMQGNYSSIYLRKKFNVANASAVTNLILSAQIDDGFIIWVNGVEAARYNMPAGDIPYNGTAVTAFPEPGGNGGFPYTNFTLANPSTYLVDGTNVIAVHGFNQSLAGSSDFGFNAQLFTYLADASLAAPRVASVSPPAGSVFYLTNIAVTFSEPVTGVDAGDLLVNGMAATGVSGGSSNSTYTFSFLQPPYGNVAITWSASHGIVDFDTPPKPFDGTAPGSTFQYALLNPSTPTVVSKSPPAGATLSNLTQITVSFSESVSGVDAGDLLVNGMHATGLSGGGATYTFTFAQPPFGLVSVGWDAGHGIQDLEMPPNAFDPARPGSTWTYSLDDQAPPAIASQVPPAGASVTNLTQITVTFTEPVTGVNAGDLLINGVPATGLSGGGSTYTFSFSQPNATIIPITWATGHGIQDLAATPNPFNATAPGATWFYTTPDTLPPTLVSIDPSPFVTVRSLTQIRVTFSEAVSGVDTNDLLINSRPASVVAGSGAGPYTFSFFPPANGSVEVRWTTTNAITDLASPPNPFAGGEWTYTLDPNASFAGKVLLNEIMYDAPGGAKSNEWVELRNVATNLINLAGWRFTRGVDFTFPNVSIPAGGYLVVAANLAAFQAQHPGVTNVIGGWSGSLANSAETIELKTALGETVNAVRYASEGDWARRERGNGPSPVISITRNGATATVNVFGHGYTGNDQIVITGADQPEYNGRFTLGGIASSSFNITVSGAPASPATGNIVCHQILDDGASGWAWFSPVAGYGASLELVNLTLPNSSGQNWLPSAVSGGTPGRANSVATNNVAPLIEDVIHFPPIPRSTDPVAISAHVRDELSNGVAGVTLFYRNHTSAGPGAFSSTNMLDDGGHSDGVSGDGLYGAVLPAQANGTVIEFYVQAIDTSGRSRTWPAPAYDTNSATGTFGTPGQFANAIYQVSNETITNSMPIIRIILTGTENATFPAANRNSDASPNCTLISSDGDGVKVRYLCDARIRGAGSRSRTPPNNRLGIPGDNPWNGLSAINLNSQYPHAQLLGNNLALKAGLPAEPARIVQYRINGVNPSPITAPVNGSGNNGAGWGAFVLVEPPNGDLAADLFPQDGGGNYYRASTGNHNADLSYQSGNVQTYLSRGYYKTSNRTENDWTDFQNLTFAFSLTGANSDYVTAISTNVNVREWMTYFAVGSLMNYGETALFNGLGDDYALYRGDVDSRFQIIGHDFDTVFGQGDTLASPTGNGYVVQTNASIFIMLNPPYANANVANLRRFLTNNTFAPFFYAELKRLCDTTFHPTNFNPLVDQLLGTWGGVGPDATTIATIKNYAANRRTIALSQIPLALTVNSTLATQNGYLFTATPSVALFGAANAIDTRKVLVNGAQANWSAFNASWTANATLQPGINRVLVQSLNSNDVEFARATVDIWYDDGSVTGVSGAIASDTTWTAATGPYNVTGTITVNSGVTLTIQAGTTLYLDSGVNITVANGGRLLAEGTETAPIRFSRTPGTATSWGGITVNGAVGSPETRIAYAHFEFNGSTAIHSSSGTLFLDHLTFGNTAVQYVSLDGSSFVVQECVFPATTASFEPVHGTAGIKSGGRGIVRRNFWGRVNNYNDSFDFTGGNRPGPILQVLNNVFMGSDDDILDLDSTDAWVEGNIFLHCHRNGASPDSSSAVSGGSDNADNSQVTIIGNLIFDCDQAANGKQTNFYTLINNTIVHQTHVGGIDPTGAVVILADDGTSQGAGMYLEGNIISDAENLTRNVTTAIVTFTNNIITQLQGAPWSGQGGENVNVDPTFVHLPTIAETTNFTTWAEAQVLWQWFSLRAGSPARGTGPGGRDKGAVIPLGASISGEPVGGTPLNSATLHVGPNRTGFGIPVNGFPNGSGFTHYKWRLDGGPWSAETPVATDITLSGLGAGPHYVEVTAKNDAGFYQDDPVFGPDASVTVSRTWTVNPAASPLRLNEILASNAGALVHSNTTPDAIELYNAGPNELDLSGISLTDDPSDPAQFLFPPDTSLAAGAYLVVFANNPDGTPGFHLGFNLPQSGGAVYLYDSPDNGGALLDSIAFGLQLTDLSIGRLGDGSWSLTQPTFGAANKAAPLGDPTRLRLNEWLAIGVTAFDNDFIELYNGDPLPVNVGGLYLSDEPLGWPNRHQIAALSFISGNGYQRFIADGDAGSGAEHLNFHLSGVQGSIGLYLPNLTPIDCITYQPQRLNVSQGRSPNGSANIVFFDTPTPGAPNPLVTGPAPNGGVLVINEVLAANASIAEVNGRTPDWIELYNGTTNTANLADLSLTDDTLQPRRFVFGAGTTLAPGGYLRVLCDDGRPATTNNTGFALKSTGGGIYLFDALANGGSLLNSVIYGLQTPNLSIGRVPDGSTNWVLTSPTRGTANVAIPNLGDTANLKVNEWMADPGPGKDDWFEIYNPNPLPVALGGLHLTDDLSDRTKHKIAALSFLGTGTNAWQQFHADGNTGAGADHVGFSLKSGGEDVGISTASGTLINGVSFGQQLTGVSEGRFPDGSTNVVSFPGTDSPGASNYRRLTTVVINEVLTHTDLPLEDAIELQNLTAQPIDVGGWWLSDDNGTLQKYQIPSPTILPASGFTVIYETHFTNRNEAALPFALSSAGDETVLSAAANNALTGYRTSVKFGAAQNGVSFGRYLNSVDEEQFVALSARTFGVDDPSSVEQFRNGSGATNAYPRVGPVVISEIMYHPPDAGTNDNVADEFIELHNITTAPVPLYDPAAPANTWHLRDAVDFDFPPGRVMAPGDYLLVVSFDPANNPAALTAFRAKYHVAAGTGIVGPYSGKLANNDDDIELRRPDTPNTNDVPYILVEHVHYFDTAPWTPLADGTGYSLQRIADNLFGNDPSNWTAATATAGPQAVSFDSDGDGMPDAWETEHGLDPFNRLDGMLDTDGDGLTNLQEYQLGSDPRNAQSGLRIESITLAANGTNVVLTFTAIANWTYSIEYIDDLGSGGWTALGGSGDIAAAPAPRSIQLTVPVSTPKRFYRLRTPWRFGPAGGLQITSIQPLPGNQVALSLNAPANLNCTVLYTTDIAAGQWTLVTSYSAVPTNRVIQLMAPASNSSGFFRLRSP